MPVQPQKKNSGHPTSRRRLASTSPKPSPGLTFEQRVALLNAQNPDLAKREAEQTEKRAP